MNKAAPTMSQHHGVMAAIIPLPVPRPVLLSYAFETEFEFDTETVVHKAVCYQPA